MKPRSRRNPWNALCSTRKPWASRLAISRVPSASATRSTSPEPQRSAITGFTGDLNRRDRTSRNRIPSGIEEQTRLTLDNIKKVLDDAGAKMADVFEVFVMFKRKEDFPQIEVAGVAARSKRSLQGVLPGTELYRYRIPDRVGARSASSTGHAGRSGREGARRLTSPPVR